MKKNISLTSRNRSNIQKLRRNKPFVDDYNTQRYAYRQTVLSTLNSTLEAIFEQNEYMATPENAALMVELITCGRELKEMTAETEKGRQSEFISFIQKCKETLPLIIREKETPPTLGEYLSRVLQDQDTLHAQLTQSKKRVKKASTDEQSQILEIQKTKGTALHKDIAALSQIQLTTFLLPEDIVGNVAVLSQRFKTTFGDLKKACTEMVHLQTLKEFFLSHPVNKDTAAQFKKIKANAPTWGHYFRSWFPSQDVPTQAVVNKMQEMASRYKPKQKALTEKHEAWINRRVQDELNCMRAEIDAIHTIFETEELAKTEKSEQEERIHTTPESIQEKKANFELHRHKKLLKIVTPLLLRAVENTHSNIPDNTVFTKRFPSIFSLLHFAIMYEGAHFETKKEDYTSQKVLSTALAHLPIDTDALESKLNAYFDKQKESYSTPIVIQAQKDFIPFMRVLTAVLTQLSPQIGPLLSRLNALVKHEYRLMRQLDHVTDDTALTILDTNIGKKSNTVENLIHDELNAVSERTLTEKVAILTEDEIKNLVNTDTSPNKFDDLKRLVAKVLFVQDLKMTTLITHTQDKEMKNQQLENVQLMKNALYSDDTPDVKITKIIEMLNKLLASNPDDITTVLEKQVAALKTELSDIRNAINEQDWEGIHENIEYLKTGLTTVLNKSNIFQFVHEGYGHGLSRLPVSEMNKDSIALILTIITGLTLAMIQPKFIFRMIPFLVGLEFCIKHLDTIINMAQYVHKSIKKSPEAESLAMITFQLSMSYVGLSIMAMPVAIVLDSALSNLGGIIKFCEEIQLKKDYISEETKKVTTKILTATAMYLASVAIIEERWPTSADLGKGLVLGLVNYGITDKIEELISKTLHRSPSAIRHRIITLIINAVLDLLLNRLINKTTSDARSIIDELTLCFDEDENIRLNLLMAQLLPPLENAESQKELYREYRKLVLIHHPDKSQETSLSDAQKEALFIAITNIVDTHQYTRTKNQVTSSEA